MATPPSQPPGGPGRGARLLDSLRKRQKEKADQTPPAGRGRAALMEMMKRSGATASAASPLGAKASSPQLAPFEERDSGERPLEQPPPPKSVPPTVAEAKKPVVPVPMGRGRGALMARIASAKSGGDKPKDTTFQSEEFETSSRLSTVASKLHGLRVASDVKSPTSSHVQSGDVSFVTTRSEASISKTPTPPNTTSPSSKESKSTSPILRPSPNPSMTPTVSRPPSRLAVSSPQHPVRVDPPETESGPRTFKGTEGKHFNASANYLQLAVEKGKGVFEFEVIFNPRIDSRDERYKLLNQQKDAIGHVKIFDGTKLFLPKQLANERTSLESVDSISGDKVELVIMFKRQLEHGNHEMIYIYNNIFKRIMRSLKLVQHNRNYFDPTSSHLIKNYDLEVWPGYITAVDRYEGGLLLQADVAHRVLRTETARDLLTKIHKKCSGTVGAPSAKQEAEKQLLGTSVLTRYNNQSYIVDDIDFDSSPKSTFVNERGESISYLDYYQNKYGIKVLDPNQPLLINRPRKKDVHEKNVLKVICLIPELCLLTGLTDAMREDFRIMKEVGSYTRVGPSQRQDALQKFVHNVRTNPAASAHLSDWGLRIRNKTIPLQARQLNPEVLCFGKGYREMVNPKADWGRTATSKNVLTSMPLKKWAIVFLQKNQPIVRQFVSIFEQQGPRMGIPVTTPYHIPLPNDRTETYLKAIKEKIDSSVQLVVTIFPQMRSDRYAAIKKLCCIEKPVASQVINLKTISNDKKVTSVVQKIALQINCKLGGELWGCLTPFTNLMVVGIDVYHDKTRKGSSIAGVVTSINASLSRYHSNVAMQQHGQEIVDALKVAFVEGLIKYYEANLVWPAHIVVFRDGVGDGQLEMAEKHEAEQFIAAFTHVNGGNGKNGSKMLAESLPPGYSPGFSFVVVQKRINTRVFAVVQKGAKEDYENPPPGTVVDHTVTRYRYKDFFLVPQSVNQGTVSPTHFVVVREVGEEKGNGISKFGPDDIQKLAYKLTHMYFNWPGTVRVPSPVQYAHKLVDLVGQHLHRNPSPQLSDRLFYL